MLPSKIRPCRIAKPESFNRARFGKGSTQRWRPTPEEGTDHRHDVWRPNATDLFPVADPEPAKLPRSSVQSILRTRANETMPRIL